MIKEVHTLPGALKKIVHQMPSVVSGINTVNNEQIDACAPMCFCWSVQELYCVIWKSDT